MPKSVTATSKPPLIDGPEIDGSSKGSSDPGKASQKPAPDISGIVEEIDTFRNLRYGWDGDQALPISPAAIESAKRFIRTAIDAIKEDFRSWHRPTPCADPDGGVELYWEETNRWLELLFRPDDPDRILVVRGEAASKPTKDEASPAEALLLVRWVLDRE